MGCLLTEPTYKPDASHDARLATEDSEPERRFERITVSRIDKASVRECHPKVSSSGRPQHPDLLAEPGAAPSVLSRGRYRAHS